MNDLPNIAFYCHNKFINEFITCSILRFQPQIIIWFSKLIFSKPFPSRIFCVTKTDEIVPVTTAINPMPDIIIIIAKILPGIPAGDMSPNPTVVMVTIVHQSEFIKLLKLVASLDGEWKSPSKKKIPIPPNVHTENNATITLEMGSAQKS